MEKKTYIINVDGMRGDYYNTQGHQGCLTPTMVSLAEQGVRYSNCKDILPAVTATNHTSILTSTHLKTHGILGMHGFYKGLDLAHRRISSRHGTAQMDHYKHRHLQCLPTFFNVVKKNNPSSTTAIISGKHWVAEIMKDDDCNVVIYGGNPDNPDFVTTPEGHILGGERHENDRRFPPRLFIPSIENKIVRPPKGTFRIPLEALNANVIPSDKWIIDQSIQTICHYDPDFMYILLNNVDSAGHTYGAFTDLNEANLHKLINPDAMMDQLYITDCEISRFIEFLKRRHTFKESRIIITSDHGMSSMKENVVDVRKILDDHGIQIKANTKWRSFGYNDNGQYNWCFSEGPQIYFYCRADIEQIIKNILSNNLDHLFKIYDEKEQRNNLMWKGDYENVIWPRIMVFLERNYPNIQYGDVLAAWSSVLADFPPHIQFLIAKLYGSSSPPGTHGTIYEQHVPLIFVSPSEHDGGNLASSGTIIDREVSVIDIIPTINALNGWSDQPTFEGIPLF